MATLEDLGFKPSTRLFTWPTAGAPSLRLVLLRELAEHVADGPHVRAPRPLAESVATVARWLASRSGVDLYLRLPGTEYAAIADDSTVFAPGIRFDQLPASLRFTLGSTAQPPADDESAGDGTAADTFARLLKARKQSAAKPEPVQWLGRIQGQAPALRRLEDCPPAAAATMPQWALCLAIRADLVAELLAELCPPPAQAATLVAIHDAKRPAPARSGRLSKEQAEALRDWAATWKRANPGDAPGRAQALMKAWPRVFPGRPKPTRQAVEKLLAHHVDAPRSALDLLNTWGGNSAQVAPKVAGMKVKNAQRATR